MDVSKKDDIHRPVFIGHIRLQMHKSKEYCERKSYPRIESDQRSPAHGVMLSYISADSAVSVSKAASSVADSKRIQRILF